jgi:iron complex transport system ATP-binding protein
MTTLNHTSALVAHKLNVMLGQGSEKILALDDVSLMFAEGRWTSIVGPNGAGKSTLLKCLAGLLPHQGSVQLSGCDLMDWPNRSRACKLSWLGQNEPSSDDLRIWDVVMLGRLPHQSSWIAAPSDADVVAVERALRSTHAWEWRERSLGQLSGGERQRVLLARALAVEADILLMDEPLANLDPPHQADWLALIGELVRQGKTVISVLHEISMALHADEMVIMLQGRVVHQGLCAEDVTHRALEAVFDHRIAVRAFEGQLVALPKI